MPQTINKRQFGMANAIEWLESRHALAPVLPSVLPDAQPESGVAMAIANSTDYRNQTDTIDDELRQKVEAILGRMVQAVPATSVHPLNLALDPYEMTDEEAAALFALPVADFPPVRK
jgi:hypothetical protein